MADVSGLPGPDHRRAVARGGLIGAALAALTLGGCISVEVTRSQDPVVDRAYADVQAENPAAVAALEFCERTPDAVHALCMRDKVTTNSVIAWSPTVTELDWAGGGIAGMPILIKDNVETADMPTTAGSLALANNAPGRDAPLVARLRGAGAVILGKTNLSEWANIRSTASVSG